MNHKRSLETKGIATDDRPSWAQSILVAVAIFAFAFWVRLPYCGESFWIDELHTAWSVWAELGDVAGRAAIGNQTPIYYWGLWFWRQIFGDGEVALRSSSVLLSSLACGLVTIGVARQTGILAGGVIAGTLLAIDPHAIFFGTELRVFAAILLVASATTWAWSCNRQAASDPRAMLVVSLVVTAALIQPTSLGVLGWAAIGPSITLVRSGITRWSGRRKLALMLVVIGAAAIAWVLAGEVVVAAWKHRQQWAAFASVRGWAQVETLWRWKSLAFVPAALGLVAWGIRRVLRRLRGERQQWLEPAAGPNDWIFAFLWVTIATAFFWAISSTGIATVFHRRYMIAALPILAWAAGSAVAYFLATVVGPMSPQRHHRYAPLATSIVLVLAVIFGYAVNERRSSRPKILRGEGWRGAAKAVRAAEKNISKTVVLSPGLIEAARFLASGDPVKMRYLAFPLDGPYRIESVEVFAISDSPVGLAARISDGEVESAILRASPASANRWANRIVAAAPKEGGIAFRHQRFGSIQVIHFDRKSLADRAQ